MQQFCIEDPLNSLKKDFHSNITLSKASHENIGALSNGTILWIFLCTDLPFFVSQKNLSHSKNAILEKSLKPTI